MEDLLLNSFLSFFFIGVIGYGIAFSTEPETINKPHHMNPYDDDRHETWPKTKEGKVWTKWYNTWWKMIVYWFYIMLAHGAIFFIMFLYVGLS